MKRRRGREEKNKSGGRRERMRREEKNEGGGEGEIGKDK